MSFGEWTPTASSTSIVAPVQSIINIQSITKVNFQEVINAKIKAEIHWLNIVKICQNFSPISISTCSSCAWALVANSKGLFELNHPCSWDKMTRK